MSNASGLRVQNLTVRFGGLTALQEVELVAPNGQLTGLIGPNGAGKTTLFNACTGLVVPSGGSIELNGYDITQFSSQRRAQLGLGRTFQRVELFDSLTVSENVSLGREARMAGSGVLSQLFSPAVERAEIAGATASALELCSLLDVASRPAAELSSGQRRLLELARVLAGSFSILLLDEPSSGLDPAESATFGRMLRNVVNRRGTGILLVEHNMSLVLSVCDYIYVLDFGNLIFEGTPAQVRTSPVVRAAYLGADAV